MLCVCICFSLERCEACKLTLSVNLSSVNDTIRVAKGDGMTFNVTFTHQDHNAFTFAINERITTHPNFACTSVRDTNDLTKTLMVQYHCVAMEMGEYHIDSYVTFCNFLYYSQSLTVIVENSKKIQSTKCMCMSYMCFCSYFINRHVRPVATINKRCKPNIIRESACINTPADKFNGADCCYINEYVCVTSTDY